MTVDAGWHQDPEHDGVLRWWNGTQWTGHQMRDTPVASRHVPASGAYRPGVGTSTFLRIGSVALVIVALWGVIVRITEGSLIRRIFSTPGSVQDVDLSTNLAVVNTPYVITLLMLISMAGVFVVWLRRSYKNLVVLGVYPLRYRSGWAVWTWLVPLVGVIRGVKLLADVWRGSDPDVPAQDPTWRDRSANTRSTVALVLAWLGTWTHLFTPPIVKPDNYFPSGVGDPSSVVWDSASVWANNIGSSLGYVMLGVAALLSFCLVDQFSNRQQQRHGRIEDFDRKLWAPPVPALATTETIACVQGHENPASNKFCVVCGSSLSPTPHAEELSEYPSADVSYCPAGHANPVDSVFCGECSSSIELVDAEPSVDATEHLIDQDSVCIDGHINPSGSGFCGECGNPLVEPTVLPHISTVSEFTPSQTTGVSLGVDSMQPNRDQPIEWIIDEQAVARALVVFSQADLVDGLEGKARSGAGGSALWGAYAVFSGFTGLALSSLNIVLLLIGVGLLVSAARSYRSHDAAALRFEGLLFAVLASWNGLITLLTLGAPPIDAGGNVLDSLPAPVWFLIAVFQGFLSSRRYKDARALSQARRPSHREREQAEATVLEMFDSSPDRPDKNLSTIGTDQGPVKLVRVSQDLVGRTRDGAGVWSSAWLASVWPTGAAAPAGDVAVSLSIGGIFLEGTVSEAGLERLEQWMEASRPREMVGRTGATPIAKASSHAAPVAGTNARSRCVSGHVSDVRLGSKCPSCANPTITRVN